MRRRAVAFRQHMVTVARWRDDAISEEHIFMSDS
jgi:hypothetical protein